MPTDKHLWDQQQLARGAAFLQSSYWGGFQQSLGHKTHYLESDGWSCLLIERSTRLGRYLFAPYGPTLDSSHHLVDAIAKIEALAKELGVVWARIEPRFNPLSGQPSTLDLKKFGRPAPHNVEPELTRIIDIKLPALELLQTISSSTRSLIRKNQTSQEIKFGTSSQPADMSIFNAMLNSVAKRNRVGFFSDEYFLKQAEVLMPAGVMRLELAYDSGKPVAGIVVHDYGTTASYTYAGSLPEARPKNVSALLLWQAVLNAQQRSIEQFDLFGIAPEDAPPSHPWYGFSAFKRKFGGQIVEYSGTWDIPLNKAAYRAYRLAYRAKKLL